MTIERFHQLLAGIFEAELGMSRVRARKLATTFEDFNDFLTAHEARLHGPTNSKGKLALRLSPGLMANLEDFRENRLDVKLTISENYIAAISRKFAQRQVDMIGAMDLDTLIVNPLLVKALNIHTPRELVGLHVEMAASRSMVTSMGFYLEDLVWASSDSIEKAPRDSNWDFKIRRQGRNHWLQIKSGTNDMDKDQISHWAKRIKDRVSVGDKAYIGFAYGKKSDMSVSLGLLKRYLPDWRMRVMVGKDLWQFVSGDSRHHARLRKILREAALSILHKKSIVSEMSAAVKRITAEFQKKYGHGEKAVEKFIKELL